MTHSSGPATDSWTAVASGNWSADSNWSLGPAPMKGEAVVIDSALALTITFDVPTLSIGALTAHRRRAGFPERLFGHDGPDRLAERDDRGREVVCHGRFNLRRRRRDRRQRLLVQPRRGDPVRWDHQDRD